MHPVSNTVNTYARSPFLRSLPRAVEVRDSKCDLTYIIYAKFNIYGEHSFQFDIRAS